MVKKSETVDGFCPQGDVCQSGLGTVHYILGVRDRCFGVRDKDFF